MVSSEEGKALIDFTRGVLTSYLEGMPPQSQPNSEWKKKAGVFLTIYKLGEVRASFGFSEALYSIEESIALVAKAAIVGNPLFPPIQRYELEDIELEVSVLSNLTELKAEQPVEYLEQITVGKDGVAVRSIKANALLLPHVLMEHHCSPRDALEMVCKKAGLPLDAWNQPGMSVFTFQAEVFREKDGVVVKIPFS